MKHLLLTEKYRPKTIEDIIVLPRIRKIFENGLNENVIFYGHFGTGKTSLAKILIGVYTKDKPFLPKNMSKDTSIEVLRNDIDEFCSKVYMGLDLKVNIKADAIKYVFLDEFERASAQFQDALKAYMEDPSNVNIRWIFSTNHINKVSKGILSRVKSINFDCIDASEEKFLKTSFYHRIQSVIAPKEEFEITKDNLVKIINKSFPDFRQTLISLDHFRRNGEILNISNIDLKNKEELFNLVLKENSFNDIYHYIMNNFGPEKVDVMISLLGRPFVDYITNTKPELCEKLFEVCYIITEHTKLLDTNTDPLILGITVVSKIMEVFNKKEITAEQLMFGPEKA